MDIQGNPVVTLLDKAFRRGGENIKEYGWTGINKAGIKVGVGLYFMHIVAYSYSTGGLILNDTQNIIVE